MAPVPPESLEAVQPVAIPKNGPPLESLLPVPLLNGRPLFRLRVCASASSLLTYKSTQWLSHLPCPWPGILRREAVNCY